MKKLILLLLLLTGCATPVTQVGDVTCGGGYMGSLAGGLIGYNIQKAHDAECIKNAAR